MTDKPHTTCKTMRKKNCWHELPTYSDPRAIEFRKLMSEIAEKAGR